jgi:uncharacterized zinc-type alcohol dehydrogenase-like protein
MPIHGHAAYAARQPLKPLFYEPGDLGPYDVEVHTEFCGICHSDIHLIDDDWALSRYPFIPGQVNAALDKLRSNQVRYRMVLKA